LLVCYCIYFHLPLFFSSSMLKHHSKKPDR